MKDVMELLRAKEQELVKVKKQIEALRIALPLLSDEDPYHPSTVPPNSMSAIKGTGHLS
jgi:hypothetical protein